MVMLVLGGGVGVGGMAGMANHGLPLSRALVFLYRMLAVVMECKIISNFKILYR